MGGFIMAEKYVIVFDTWVDGWQTQREYTEGNPEGEIVTYKTVEEAQAEIDDCFSEHRQNLIDSGENPDDLDDEPSEFVLPLSEYIEGRKTIFTGS